MNKKKKKDKIVFENYIAELKEIFGDSSSEMQEILQNIKKYKDLTSKKEDFKKSNKYDEKIDELHKSIKKVSEKITKKFKEQKDLASKKEMAQNDNILNDPLLLSSYEYDKSSLSSDILNLNEEIKEKKSKIEIEEKEKELVEKNLDREIKKVYSKLESEIEKISKKISEKIEENKNTYMPSAKKIDEVKAEIENKKSENLNLVNNIEKLIKQRDDRKQLASNQIFEIQRMVLGAKEGTFSMEMYMQLNSIKQEIENTQKQLEEKCSELSKIKDEIETLENEKNELEVKKDLQQKDNRNKYISLLYIKDDIKLENMDYVENLFEEFLTYVEEKNEEKIEPKIEYKKEENDSNIDSKLDVKENKTNSSKDEYEKNNEKHSIINLAKPLRDYASELVNYGMDEDSAREFCRAIEKLYVDLIDLNYEKRPNKMEKATQDKILGIINQYLKTTLEKNENDENFKKLKDNFVLFLEDYFGKGLLEKENKVEPKIDEVKNESEENEEQLQENDSKVEKEQTEINKQNIDKEEIIDLAEEDFIEELDYELDSENIIQEDDYITEEDYITEDDYVDYEDLYNKKLDGSQYPPLYMKLLYHKEVERNLENLYKNNLSIKFTSLKGLQNWMREKSLYNEYKKSKEITKGITKISSHIKSYFVKPKESEKDEIKNFIKKDLNDMITNGETPKTKYLRYLQSIAKKNVEKKQTEYKEAFKNNDYVKILELVSDVGTELEGMNDFNTTFEKGEFYNDSEGFMHLVTDKKVKGLVKIDDVGKELKTAFTNVIAKMKTLNKENNEEQKIEDDIENEIT